MIKAFSLTLLDLARDTPLPAFLNIMRRSPLAVGMLAKEQLRIDVAMHTKSDSEFLVHFQK